MYLLVLSSSYVPREVRLRTATELTDWLVTQAEVTQLHVSLPSAP